MQSILNEITKLRRGAPLTVDYHNKNRYRLLIQEPNGTKTSYCFSTPIYNRKTGRLLGMRFQVCGETIYLEGSSADISISQPQILRMESADGSASVRLPQKPALRSSRSVQSGPLLITPTANGIAVTCDVRYQPSVSFSIETDQPHLGIRANDRCFALMKEEFRPFLVLSCIGSQDASGSIIAPTRVVYQKLTDKSFGITVCKTSPLAQSVLFELNLYENKLFQDTTAESANPAVNNAFGGTGFIGTSSAYGEQWLYTRPDLSRIPELSDRRIRKAILHLPKLNRGGAEISAFRVSSRFCSFGSNWNNKIPGDVLTADSVTANGYQSLDITSLLSDPRTGAVLSPEGMILKPKRKDCGFSVIATGDSCLAPQILEINCR